MPFYAWQCITLELEKRNIDLVIKDSNDMMNFIKFLIIKMNTVDGIRNSATILKKALFVEMQRD